MSDNQQQPMWKRLAGTKPRVYQVTPGSPIWWTDVRDQGGVYFSKISFSRAEAFEKAHKYAEMVSV